MGRNPCVKRGCARFEALVKGLSMTTLPKRSMQTQPVRYSLFDILDIEPIAPFDGIFSKRLRACIKKPANEAAGFCLPISDRLRSAHRMINA
jgi:hypothetical protein